MTSSPVKGVNSLMNYVSAKAAGNAKDDLAGNFTDAFSKASGQQGMMLQNGGIVQGSTKVQINRTDKKGLDANASANESSKNLKTQNVKVDEKTQGQVRKTGEKLVEQVADELGVSEEEVKSAMEMLGLTMVDLLDQDNMTQLVLTIEGADMISLVTDEGLYNSLQNILNMVDVSLEELQKELAVSPEDMKVILEQCRNTEPRTQDIPTEDAVQSQDGTDDYTVTVERDGEVMRVSVEVDGNVKTESAEVTSQKVQMPEEDLAAGSKEKETKQDTSSHSDQNHENLFMENFLNRDTVVKNDVPLENPVMSTANTQDIMDQIMDYMKIQVKSDLTQMQIQLHPASLGTVNINISSKEGVITAQFLTQNEVVKAAIESQIVQLKNSFEEQGLKVEAVEVTVESHQFERNLSGDGNGHDQPQNERKKGVRKINLNELNPEEEAEMDEAQQIAVAMMSADGNTVDYTA